MEEKGTFFSRDVYKFSDKTRRDRTDWMQNHRYSRRQKTNQCESCGSGKDLEGHHIDGNDKNNYPENIQTLCRFCHRHWHDIHRRQGLKVNEPMPILIYSEQEKNNAISEG